MATGDQDDLISRLQRWLPTGWFPTTKDEAPRLYSVLAGFASLLSQIYLAIQYVRLQTRLATLTDGFVDLASADFFGDRLPRLNAESDDRFSMRVRLEIFRKKLTREAIDELLFQMTGAHPLIVELERPADIGGWGCRRAWGVAGPWGGRADSPAVFITTKHAGQFGVPLVNGWGCYAGGWGVGRQVWADADMITGTGFTDAQIMAALNRIRAAGVTYWVNITNDVAAAIPESVLGTETGAVLVDDQGREILI